MSYWFVIISSIQFSAKFLCLDDLFKINFWILFLILKNIIGFLKKKQSDDNNNRMLFIKS